MMNGNSLFRSLFSQESVLALVCVVSVGTVVFSGCGGTDSAINLQNPDLNESYSDGPIRDMFFGLNPASPQEIAAALPEIQGQMALIKFKSKFCLDCKKMAPILEELMPQFSTVTFKELDIAEDKKTYKAAFDTFQPSTVPTLVFITPEGDIANVLYGFHDKDELTQALNGLTGQETQTAEDSQA